MKTSIIKRTASMLLTSILLVTGIITAFPTEAYAVPEVLDSVTVKRLPNKTTYLVGECLDLRGISVVVSYDKGKMGGETGIYTASPSNGTKLNTVGTQKVTISYTYYGITKTTSFNVTVKARTCQVTYSANQGMWPSSYQYTQTVTCGVKFTIPTAKPTRSGFTFMGWSTSASGTSAYQPGGSLAVSGNTTLYAVWKKV